MTLWTQGGYYRDNHALELPASLPPGEYELWVLVYDWRDGKALALRNASSASGADHVVIAKIRVTG